MNAPAPASRPENRTDSADLAARKALARLHLDAGQHEAAAQVCGQILRGDPGDAEARRMMEEAMAQEAKLAENLYDGKDCPAARF
jgi:hypothetical protein